MNRIDKALLVPIPWAWSDLQKMEAEPCDLMYVCQHIPKNSAFHRYYKRIVDQQMCADGGYHPRGIYYPTLLRILAVAISAF